MRVIGALLATVAVVFPSCPALAACDDCRSWNSAEAIRSETLQLRNAQLILQRGALPDAWDAGVYVAADAIEEVTDAFEGVEAHIAGGKDTLQLSRLDLTFAPTGIRGIASIAATESMTGARVELVVEGYLDYLRAELTGENSDAHAMFAFRPSHVYATAKWGFWNGKTDAFAGRLLANQMGRHFVKMLTFPVPIVRHLPVRIGIAKNAAGQHSKSDTKDIGGARIDIEQTMPESDVGPSMTAMLPLYTPDGVWLLARLSSVAQVPDTKSLPKDRSKLVRERDALLAEITKKLGQVQEPPDDICLWFGKALFAAIPDRIRSLDEVHRTFHMKSVRVQGSLYDKMKDNKVIGEYGVRVNLKHANSATGYVRVDSADYSWNEKNGAAIRATASAHADIGVGVEVDLGPGGGFVIDMTPRGNVPATAVDARIHLRSISTEYGKALYAGVESDCSPVEITALAGGEIEFGARLYENISVPNEAALIVDPVPRFQDMRALIKGADRFVTFTPNWVRRQIQLRDVAVKPDGYRITLDTDFRAVKQPEIETKMPSELAKIEGAVSHDWANSYPAKCGKRKPPVVLIAGQDFGENNLLVKALKEFVETLNKGWSEAERQAELQKHNLVLAYQDLQDIKDPAKAPEVVARVAERTYKAAGKAVDQAARASQKAKHQFEANVNGAKRAYDKAEDSVKEGFRDLGLPRL